jgi:hypothetical protein
MRIIKHLYTAHQEVAVSRMHSIRWSYGARNLMLIYSVFGSLTFPAEHLLKSVRPSVRLYAIKNSKTAEYITMKCYVAEYNQQLSTDSSVGKTG